MSSYLNSLYASMIQEIYDYWLYIMTIAIMAVLYIYFIRERKPPVRAPTIAELIHIQKHPSHPQNLTLKELLEYDGEKRDKIYISIKDTIFDVTTSKGFYGHSGPYGGFAGRDASRGLAMGEVLTLPPDKIQSRDRLEDLSKNEKITLEEWFEFFNDKYPVIGTLTYPE